MFERSYEGGELTIFAHARHWKSYYSRHVTPFVSGDVLEVGSGLGGTTAWLRSGRERSWTCLEPDPDLARESRERYASASIPAEVIVATLRGLDAARTFDTIIYIDVLEHIEDDAAEMKLTSSRLRPGGNLIVLSPAFNFLYSEFDRQIGHFRRYTKKTLTAVVPASLARVKLVYLDMVGMLLSLGNRFLLRSGGPTESQVRVWDDYVVPLSERLDPLLGHAIGKTVVGVWQKPR